ncbi:hypothetical protein [Nitratidesulfovibrio vulgaris]|uniref:Uncharacterized protein n=1 Tax=Nitratidesulfovibrio vulgaris (strain DP4) TaxID=391774 RepID=A0A0H3A981_NITV4|nr:hypothetical protein [Nitratidesulfovibrio vulgaris]ABM28061.1 conserved hypothetical protein [Nitratidesulfovibrio vulgaris DP4]
MKPIFFNDEMVRAILGGRKTQTRRVMKPQPRVARFGETHPTRPNGVIGHVDGALGGGDYHVWQGPRFQAGLTHGGVYLALNQCQYQPGDRLWVREAWRIGAWQLWSEAVAIDYRADSFCRREWIRIGDDDAGEAFDKYLKQSIADVKAAGLSADADGHYHWKAGESPCRWRPSIHMPRWASRITLEITDVRVQRLRSISEDDARAEGVEHDGGWEEPDGEGFTEGFGFRDYQTDEESFPYRNPCTSFKTLWDSIAKPGTLWRDNPWVWANSFQMVEA